MKGSDGAPRVTVSEKWGEVVANYVLVKWQGKMFFFFLLYIYKFTLILKRCQILT